MKMKIAALIFLVLLPPFAATVAYGAQHGAKPQAGKGTVTITRHDLKGSARTASDNSIATYNANFTFAGALSGKAVALERDVFHGAPGSGFATFQGVANFTGLVGSVSGKLEMRYVGTDNGTFIKGQFVITSASSGLGDFHGQGEFSGQAGSTLVGTALNYTIEWHFAPPAKTKSAA